MIGSCYGVTTKIYVDVLFFGPAFEDKFLSMSLRAAYWFVADDYVAASQWPNRGKIDQHNTMPSYIHGRSILLERMVMEINVICLLNGFKWKTCSLLISYFQI